MSKLFVCTNVETLVSGTWLEGRPDLFAVESLWDLVKNFYNQNQDFSDYDFDSHYKNWHGGKFDRFFHRCGFVAVDSNSTDEIRSLAWSLSYQIAEEVEEQAYEEFMEVCQRWADELEEGNITLDEFKAKVAPELLNSTDDYESVEKAVALLRNR